MAGNNSKLAALIFSSITIPGDERSRTNPGHGYPEHQQETIEIKEFKNEQEMIAWVKEETTGPYRSYKKFKLIRYEELTFTTDVHLNGKIS